MQPVEHLPLLHRLKLSWLAPRPRHPAADAAAQAEFSQLLDCNYTDLWKFMDLSVPLSQVAV